MYKKMCYSCCFRKWNIPRCTLHSLGMIFNKVRKYGCCRQAMWCCRLGHPLLDPDWSWRSNFVLKINWRMGNLRADWAVGTGISVVYVVRKTDIDWTDSDWVEDGGVRTCVGISERMVDWTDSGSIEVGGTGACAGISVFRRNAIFLDRTLLRHFGRSDIIWMRLHH